MIVFRGWGWTVFFIGIACFVAGLVGASALDPGSSATHTAAQRTTDGWRATALCFAIEAPIIWIIAAVRERGGPGRDDFSYIPLKYWPYILGVLAIAAFVASLFGAYLPAW
jgi:hypothetical protein